MVDTGGFAVPGATAVSPVPGGVCAEKIDYDGAADGALTVKITPKGDYVEVDNRPAPMPSWRPTQQAVYTLDRNAVCAPVGRQEQIRHFQRASRRLGASASSSTRRNEDRP